MIFGRVRIKTEVDPSGGDLGTTTLSWTLIPRKRERKREKEESVSETLDLEF